MARLSQTRVEADWKGDNVSSDASKRKRPFSGGVFLYEEGNARGPPISGPTHRADPTYDERLPSRRAKWLTGVLAALVGLGFGCVVFLMEDLPNHISQFAAEFSSAKTVCTLGIGSLGKLSLVAFGWLGIPQSSGIESAAGGMPTIGDNASGAPGGQTSRAAPKWGTQETGTYPRSPTSQRMLALERR